MRGDGSCVIAINRVAAPSLTAFSLERHGPPAGGAPISWRRNANSLSAP
jgi:hypothetical protein